MKLIRPELCARLGSGRVAPAGVPVPEAMHEDDSMLFEQRDVRRTRQTARVEAKSVARSVQDGANTILRLNIFSFDGGHHLGTGT